MKFPMYKNEISRNCKLAWSRLLMIKIYRDLLQTNGSKFMMKNITMLTKKLELKLQC